MKTPKKSARTVIRKKPRTAYELLQRVAEHILEEPKRYWQGTWALLNKGEIEDTVGSVPTCGTAACRGGWIVALHDGLPATRRMANDCDIFIGDRACAILGLDWIVTRPLFDAYAIDCSLKPGTKAYAKEGARGIYEFMQEHATHLHARVLKGI